MHCSYSPSKSLVGEHLKFLSKNLALQSSKYGRFVFIGDFNFIGDLMENEAMKDLYGLTSLNGKPTLLQESCKSIVQ